eukprot:gnl/TRDRNA2_/TRDRNA2_155482_c1_seq1.p1 gnl/TRDRNA2_/TRDRNA2_155482_c1~~gnl/TRDRNA2_/TRDRNA2_155482_c1_seq1.p1  ORF type:complete len:551 (+),score=28.96 gnl/TRDRNA2_/TRDRNA2_155482_c1_seq1:1-1653(+)
MKGDRCCGISDTRSMLAYLFNFDLDRNATCRCVDSNPNPTMDTYIYLTKIDKWFEEAGEGWKCPPKEESACKSGVSSPQGKPISSPYEYRSEGVGNKSSKIAWCLAGNLRTFATTGVQYGFRRIWSIVGETVWGRPDLFLYGTLTSNSKHSWSMVNAYVPNETAVREVIAAAGFKRATLTASEGAANGKNVDCFIGRRRECFHNGAFFRTTQGVASLVNQYTHLSHCFDMVVEYEKERSAPYDIVILSRPDLWFHSSFNQTDELQQALYRASIGMVSHNADYWFILPRAFAANVSDSRHVFRNCRKGDRCCGVSKAEEFATYLFHVEPQERSGWSDLLQPSTALNMKTCGQAKTPKPGTMCKYTWRNMMWPSPHYPQRKNWGAMIARWTVPPKNFPEAMNGTAPITSTTMPMIKTSTITTVPTIKTTTTTSRTTVMLSTTTASTTILTTSTAAPAIATTIESTATSTVVGFHTTLVASASSSSSTTSFTTALILNSTVLDLRVPPSRALIVESYAFLEVAIAASLVLIIGKVIGRRCRHYQTSLADTADA